MKQTSNELKKQQNLEHQQGRTQIFRITKMKPQCFDISPCRKIISVGYINKCLILWDIVCCQKLKCHQLPFIPTQILYSGDGKYLLIKSKQHPKKIYIYKLSSMEQEQIVSSTYLYQKILQFNSPQNQEALIMGLSNMSIINYKTKQVQKQMDFQFVSLTTLKNKQELCSVDCHYDIGTINIIQLKRNLKKIKRVFFNVKNGNINIKISSNNYFIVSSNKSKNRIWNIQTMKLLRKKRYGEDQISELTINSFSNLVYFHLSSDCSMEYKYWQTQSSCRGLKKQNILSISNIKLLITIQNQLAYQFNNLFLIYIYQYLIIFVQLLSVYLMNSLILQ